MPTIQNTGVVSVWVTCLVRRCERGYLLPEPLSLYLLWFWTCFTTHAIPRQNKIMEALYRSKPLQSICTVEISFVCITSLGRILQPFKWLLYSSPFSSVSAKIYWLSRWIDVSLKGNSHKAVVGSCYRWTYISIYIYIYRVDCKESIVSLDHWRLPFNLSIFDSSFLWIMDFVFRALFSAAIC